MFITLAVSFFLRIFFRQRSISLYAQFIGFIEDLFIVLELFFLVPFAAIGVQLFLVLDAFMYKKMHLRMRLHYCSHLLHLKTVYHSAKELGLGRFLVAAGIIVIVNIFGYQHVEVSWMAVVGVGAAAVIGVQFLSKTEAYAVHNMFFQEQILLVRYLGSLFKPKAAASSLWKRIDGFSGPKQFEVKIEPGEKPHVVLIFLESFGAKYTGGPATPCFNRLAREGILLSNFYSNGTLTYRALISGLFGVPPASTAVRMSPYIGIPFVGLPELMKKAGYKTGFLHNGSLSYDRQWEFLEPHFDEIVDQNSVEKDPSRSNSWGAPDESLMRYTADWLARQNGPTFTTLFTISNHHPWIVPTGYLAPSFRFASNSPQERFLQTVHYSDYALGLFVDLLREKNLSKKTILVIVGDHGQPMGEHQGNFYNSRFLYEENVRVPLLIVADGRIAEPKVIDDLGSHVDILPTLMDLLGLQGDQHGMGSSLMRQMERSVMLQNPYAEGFIGCREKNWKWIENRLSEQGELYDLSLDPEEKNNLAEMGDFREKTRNYFAAIDDLYKHQKVVQKPRLLELVPDHKNLCQDLIPDLPAGLKPERAGIFEQAAKRERAAQQDKDGVKIDKDFCGRVLDLSSRMILDQELIASISPRLQRINLKDCLLLTDAGIGFIFSNCPDLTKLNLKGVSDLTDRVFGVQHKLQHLDISDANLVTDQGIVQLMKGCPNLTELLVNCQSVTDVGMIGSRLTRLHLFEAHHIPSFKALLQNNPNLFHLEINGCTHLTDETLLGLEHHFLEYLTLIDAPQITDRGLASLAKLPLRSLYLKNCPRVSQDALQLFGKTVIYED